MAECAINKPPTCYELDKTGFWGEAVRQHRPVILNDYQADNPLKKGYPEGHVQLLKFMTVPIIVNESIVSVIGLANKVTDYDEMDILQITLLMETAWKVISRKTDEIALQEGHKRLILALNAAKAGTWEWGITTNEHFWSKELFALYGLTSQDTKPSYEMWMQSIHPDDRGLVESTTRTAVYHENEWNVEWRVNNPGSSERWLMSLGKPEFDAHGQVILYRGIVVDITERKQSENEAVKIQAQLNQAQKLETIGTLAGGIAHDFNNILSAILGYTELAKTEIGEHGSAGKDLQQVITAAKRAVELVRQILTISRKSEQQRQPVKIQYIIKEVIKLLRPSITTSIEIKSNIDPECPAIFADPTEIYQMIMNLCTNAFHAMRDISRDGHVMEICLTPIKLDETAVLERGLCLSPGRFVKLTVSDTGYGIDAKIMPRIFDPYFTTKEKGAGTGLGLATVHSIVTRGGGALSVQSKIAEGTTFTVYLPAYEAEIFEQKQIEHKRLPHGGTEKIMVVDDEEVIAQLLQRTLTALGYHVSAYASCEEAKRIFIEQPMTFDLVITDFNMPKIMGTDMAQSFLEIRPDIPIILCSGSSEKIDIEKVKAIGIRKFLYKPVDQDALAWTVRKILDEKVANNDR